MSSKQKNPKLIEKQILVVSPTQATTFLLKNKFENCGYLMKSVKGTNEILSIEEDYLPDLIIVEAFNELNPEDFKEMIVLINQQYENALVYVTYKNILRLEATELFRLDVSGVFNFPYEEELLADIIFENVPVKLPVKMLKTEYVAEVSILELREADKLPFDVLMYMQIMKNLFVTEERTLGLSPRLLISLKN